MSRVRQLDAERPRDGRAPLEALALSGHARERDRTRAVEAGFHAYLTARGSGRPDRDAARARNFHWRDTCRTF
jgi:CheY-like chemotaxis protein